MKKKIIIILMMILSFSFFSAINKQEIKANGVPYNTYTYSNSSKRFVWTQDAYIPLSIQYDLGGIELKDPQDITIDSENNIFIADAQQKMIIRYNLETDETISIGEGILSKPSGVHVGDDNKLYVADSGNKAAYQFTFNPAKNNYEITNKYVKPIATPYFDDDDSFEPIKVVTDHANIVYIVLAGNHNGMAKFNKNAEFTGYFGGNQLPATFSNLIRQFLFDEEQRRKWFSMIPAPVYNAAVDEKGLILTTSKKIEGYKKLNIANQVFNESIWGFEDNEDLFVGPNNTIFTISGGDGSIVEYSPEGDILFVFSGKDNYNQKGLFKSPKGIAVDSRNNIYVVDNHNNAKSLQIFIPTEFANTIHEAISLYYDGRYTDSLEPWKKVLKMNSLFDLANKGIGDAHFANLDYKDAMNSYIYARDQEGYSEAYWEVRNQQLLKSGTAIVVITVSLILLVILNQFLGFSKYIFLPIRKIHKYLKKFKIYEELIFGFYILKKPSDGFYGIKRENKSSNITALIYILLFFIAYMFWQFNTSFLFNDVITSEINVVNEGLIIFGVIAFWVLSNYLIGSIRDGEGKMSNILQGTAYILLPLIIMLPVASIISNFLTYNEKFIYTVIFIIGIMLSVVYLIIMVKEIHFYDMKPTIANILISIFTAVMIVVFIIIIYMLFSEVIGLFQDIIREVSGRV
ncbi:YIP1 family protein [Haploplasma modicum]|uniref:YIP1 family protein n=1 Tax=Haploplasma modicum TaxID=2150 RepID=UPI00214CC7FB|nr:YIP1 family protein [Haploplasma modicum]MCR1808785.1 YIP1 family protein [Haploplasma modicum]